MPYASQRQQRWAHTLSGKDALGAATVKEFDSASKGMKLPESAAPGREAKVRRLNAMTTVYPEKKKTEDVDLGSKGSFTVHKGALHEMLGIPQDQTIPKAREESAAHQSSNPLLKRRAISALGFRGMK